MNLWRDLELGEKAPDIINVIVEIPKGSKNKYEVDKKTGLIKLDRAMETSQDYPFDYGFSPQTLWEDNDPLDVVILTTNALYPGILVEVRPVGIMRMVDGGEGDDKIISVPMKDPRWEGVNDLSDVNKHTLKEIRHFFETYKSIEGKVVEVGDFEDVFAAKKAILRSVVLYNNKYSK